MAVVSLQYRFDGPTHAPVVLLLPALGTTLAMWEPQLPELTRRRRVLRANHRGHGRSPAPEGPYALSELAGDVLALLDECELERVSVVGTSLGGMVASWLATHHPDRVDRLALVATTALMPARRQWRERADNARVNGMGTVVEEVTRRWFTPGFVEQRPDILEQLREEFLTVSPTGFGGCCEAIAAMDERRSLARVRAPTMVISAAHDPVTPPDHGKRMASGIPHARFHIVAGGAHLVSIERADRVSELLMEHLT